MMEDEWTEEPLEMKFRLINLEAANRGVKIDRIFIFSKIILYCFNIIPCQTKSLFIGFLLDSKKLIKIGLSKDSLLYWRLYEKFKRH